MIQLVLFKQLTDDFTYSFDSFIPFEYESKEKFCYDMLIKLDEWKKDNKLSGYKKNFEDYYTQCIEIFNGYYFSPYEIENFENDIYTLTEWFEKNKQQHLK